VINKGNKSLGKWGEELAMHWLTGQGLEVVAMSYRTPHGEIDLIMEDQGQIVFVEVKTRTNTKLGFPEDAITFRKFNHILDSASYYFQQNPGLTEDWRIDVIAIIGTPTTKIPDIHWFKNVHP
jgi:putative endonuclease